MVSNSMVQNNNHTVPLTLDAFYRNENEPTHLVSLSPNDSMKVNATTNKKKSNQPQIFISLKFNNIDVSHLNELRITNYLV